MTESEQNPSSIPEGGEGGEGAERDRDVQRLVPSSGQPDPVVASEPEAAPAQDDDQGADRVATMYPSVISPVGSQMTGIVLPLADPTDDA